MSSLSDGPRGDTAGRVMQGQPMLVRERLIATLRNRFNVALVRVQGSAGFGKSTLLTHAINANRARPAGIDLRVNLIPRDRDSEFLVGHIMSSAGLVARQLPHPDLDDFWSWVRSCSPLEVCVVLDDVHELAPSPSASTVLSRLLTEGPANLHVVVAGRSLAGLDLPEGGPLIGEDQLAFTQEESDLIVGERRNGTDRVSVGGWPALTVAAASIDHHVAADFVLEEVFDALDPAVQRAMLGLGAARALSSTAVLSLAAAPEESPVGRQKLLDAVLAVPLVTAEDGVVSAHALWSDIFAVRGDDDIVRETVGHIIDSAPDTAIELAARIGDWDLADSVAFSLAEAELTGVSPLRCRALCRGVPDQDLPGYAILSSLAEAANDQSRSVARLFSTAALLRRNGDWTRERVPLIVATVLSWVARDDAALSEIAERVRSSESPPEDWFPTLVEGLAAQLGGNLACSAELLRSIRVSELPPAAAALVERAWAMIAGLSGDLDLLTDVGLAAATSSTDVHVSKTPLAIAWLRGDVSEVEQWQRTIPDARVHPSDQLTQLLYYTQVRASYGVTADLEVFAGHPCLEVDEACAEATLALVAIVKSVIATASGELDEARSHLAAIPHPLGPAVVQQLGRAFGYAYVLAPELREALDDLQSDLHDRRRRVATTLLALRAGEPVHEELPEPSQVMADIPLEWSCELAVLGVAAGLPRSHELMRFLRDTAGARAARLLSPAPGRAPRPGPAIRLELIGRTSLSGPGGPEAHWRRRRVREVLSILALRQRITRAALARTLWAGLSEDRAHANLRVTLTYLRSALGDSGHDEPCLLMTGDEIELVRQPRLTVDIWDFERHVRESHDPGPVEVGGQVWASMDAAISLWRGDPLPDLAYVDEFAAAIEALRRDAVRIATRRGEWLLADGQAAEARAAVRKALDIDPIHEPAHRVLIAAYLQQGDRDGAARALASCRSALAELGLTPGEGTRVLENRVTLRSELTTAPSRPRLPLALPGEHLRADLIEHLERRWVAPVTWLHGPSGAGKTIALAQALRNNERSPRGIDVWCQLERGTSPETLERTIIDALSGPSSSVAAADAIAARVPVQICVVVDNAQAANDGVQKLLADLARSLPANGHLVIAGTGDPPVPLSRLRIHGHLADIPVTPFRPDATASGHVGSAVAAHPTPLQVCLFGRSCVMRAGEVATRPEWRRRRTRELLAMLVFGDHSRSELTIALWPENADQVANLRVALHHLRKLIELDDASVLWDDGSRIGLKRDNALFVDAWELADALDAAEAADNAGRPDLALSRLRVVMRLWAGGPDPQLCEFGPVGSTLRALHRRTLACLGRGGELMLLADRPSDAILFADAVLAADPLDQRACRVMITGCLAVNDNDAARAVLARCTEHAGSAGIPLSDATQVVARMI